MRIAQKSKTSASALQSDNSTNPPASLTLRSLSLLFLTTFSISHPNAQHHASRSTLLLVLNTASLWLPFERPGTGCEGWKPPAGAFDRCPHDAADADDLRYQITKSSSSSRSSVSRPSKYRRGRLGDSGLYSPGRRASAAKYPEQTYASSSTISFELR